MLPTPDEASANEPIPAAKDAAAPPLSDAAQTSGTHAKESSDAAPAPQAKPPLNKTISNTLERTKPYRDLIAIVVAVAAVIFGIITSAFTYFVTHHELSSLECRILDNIELATRRTRTDVGLLPAKLKRAEASRLLDHPSDANSVIIKSLLKEADDLEKEQEKKDADHDSEFRSIITSCNHEPQKPEATPK